MAYKRAINKKLLKGMCITVVVSGTVINGTIKECAINNSIDPHIEIESIDKGDEGTIYIVPLKDSGVIIGYDPDELKKIQKVNERNAQKKQDDDTNGE